MNPPTDGERSPTDTDRRVPPAPLPDWLVSRVVPILRAAIRRQLAEAPGGPGASSLHLAERSRRGE